MVFVFLISVALNTVIMVAMILPTTTRLQPMSTPGPVHNAEKSGTFCTFFASHLRKPIAGTLCTVYMWP